MGLLRICRWLEALLRAAPASILKSALYSMYGAGLSIVCTAPASIPKSALYSEFYTVNVLGH